MEERLSRRGERDDPPGLAVAEHADPRAVDLWERREVARLGLRVAGEHVDRRRHGSFTGVHAARLPDPALVVRNHGDPEQLAERCEDLELLTRLRARSVRHHDGRERPEPVRQRQGRRIDAHPHFPLVQSHACVLLRAARLRPGDA